MGVVGDRSGRQIYRSGDAGRRRTPTAKREAGDVTDRREGERERAEAPDDGLGSVGITGRRTTFHGEKSDLYGQRDFRERERGLRGKFEI
jgi:hypothetical protein